MEFKRRVSSHKRNKFYLIYFLLVSHCWSGVLSSRNPCDRNPCQNGATCSVRTGSSSGYLCSCMYGWRGHNCTKNKNDCQPDSCKNGATCVDKNNGRFQCNCKRGFVGRFCDHRDPCLQRPCRNNGTCKSTPIGKWGCICPLGLTGEDCSIKLDGCGGVEQPQFRASGSGSNTSNRRHSPCENGGRCVSVARGNTTFECHCRKGFNGSRCQDDIRECDAKPCLNGGTCLDKIGFYKCVCPNYFEGDQCEISLLPTTTTAPLTQPPTPPPCPLDQPSCVLRPGETRCPETNRSRDCGPWANCSVFLTGRVSCQNHFADGRCDLMCNTRGCLFDGFDCQTNDRSCPKSQYCSNVFADGVCHPNCSSPECMADGGDCLPSDTHKDQSRQVLPGELILVLNVHKERFQSPRQAWDRRELLRILTKILRSLVLARKDSRGQWVVDPINDGEGSRIHLLIETTICRKLQSGPCISSVNEAASHIMAALTTGVLQSPFSVRQVIAQQSMPVDPDHFKPPTNPVIFLLVGGLFLALLSGLLLAALFRDRLEKEIRRIQTSGTWYPPNSGSHMLPMSTFGGGYLVDFSRDSSDQLYPSTPKRMKLDLVPEPIFYQSETLNKRDQPSPTGLVLMNTMATSLQTSDGVHPIKTEVIYPSLRAIRKSKLQENNNNLNTGSALHIAASMNSGAQIVKHFVDTGSDVTQFDQSGRTPMDIAAAAGAYETATALLPLLGNSTNKEPRTTTPLIEAIKSASESLALLLICEGPSWVALTDSTGRTALHWAAATNFIPVLGRLLTLNCVVRDINVRDHNDCTALFLAVQEGCQEVVQFLLDSGASPDLPDSMDRKPLQVALASGFLDIYALLATWYRVHDKKHNFSTTKNNNIKTSFYKQKSRRRPVVSAALVTEDCQNKRMSRPSTHSTSSTGQSDSLDPWNSSQSDYDTIEDCSKWLVSSQGTSEHPKRSKKPSTSGSGSGINSQPENFGFLVGEKTTVSLDILGTQV